MILTGSNALKMGRFMKALCLLLTVVRTVPTSNSNCLSTHRKLTNVPYLEFSIPTGHTCWEYCRYLDDCTALSFKLETPGICSFYNDVTLEYAYIWAMGNETVVVGEKICLSRIETEKKFVTKVRTDGVYIKRRETGACLQVSSTPWEPGKSWKVDWGLGCGEVTLWLVERLESMGTVHDVVKIKDKESGKCMTTIETNCGPGVVEVPLQCPLAIMKNCSEEEGDQKLFLHSHRNVDLQIKLQSLTLSSKVNGTYVPIVIEPHYDSQDNRHLLNDFNLVYPTEVPCKRLEVSHGSVLVDPSQPIHVPGETIQVLCDPRYAVRTQGGYSPYFITGCSIDLEIPQCIKVPCCPD